MKRVAVRILHPKAASDGGQLERGFADVRLANAGRLAAGFGAAGLTDIQILAGEPDGVAFGTRARGLVAGLDPLDGLVVVGSGALPLARERDLARFAEVARSGERVALVNNRYSADIVALGRIDVLGSLPDLEGDNALPRWLDEVGGVEVRDVRSSWRLAMDLDSPLDALLTGLWPDSDGTDRRAVDAGLARLRAVARNRRAELVVAGRTSAATLRWLERSTACRVRALVEERGLRAASPEAQDREREGGATIAARPPRSVLGMLLDHRGPAALGTILAELGDGAVVDSRVLLAHRLGRAEALWPRAEDRFASDLLLADRIEDPWLREATASAAAASIPVLLGGHSVVGPGIRLALRGFP